MGEPSATGCDSAVARLRSAHRHMALQMQVGCAGSARKDFRPDPCEEGHAALPYPLASPFLTTNVFPTERLSPLSPDKCVACSLFQILTFTNNY